MLRELHIRNLAILESATLELGSGFNVLSGETGAGKSIVVDSLTLLAGGRASTELIRTGADALSVTGVLLPGDERWRGILAELGLDADGDELIIRREISRAGRNRVFVNDQPVTLKVLAELAPALLRIHGQREELGLIEAELQRTWLDRCGGKEGRRLLARVADAHARYRELAERLERSSGDDAMRQQRLDLLRFQLAELEEAGLVVGEEDELRREREVLRHSEAIQQALSRVCELLFEQEAPVYGELTRASQALHSIEPWEPRATEWVAELEDARIRVGELEAVLRRRFDEVEADPKRLDAIGDRLVTLERLFRKYGQSSAEALSFSRDVAAELNAIEMDAGSLEELERQAAEALTIYREVAEKLSVARRQWAGILIERVEKELVDLALDKARFEVALEPRRRSSSPLEIAGEAVEIGERGYDQVVFMFSPNPGEELRPLAKVASGGELSRLYLAVQLAVQDSGSGVIPVTLVFDEVDSGISGAEAALLGGKLRRLAQGGQVLAVTHLPQVASQADIHFKVSKKVRQGRTHTELERLEATGRIEEVARMLAGSEVTELSLSHARELIAGVGV